MRVAFVPLALVLAAFGSAQSVLLRYHPPVGKTVSYTLTTAMSMTSPMGAGGAAKPMRFNQTVPMSIHVVSQQGGLTTLETRSGPVKMGSPGSPGRTPPSAKPTVVRMTIDELGTPKNATGGGQGAAVLNSMSSAMGGGSQGVVFPKKSVKVGDTWTSSLDFGKLMGAVAGGAKMNGKIPLVFKLAAVKNGVATLLMTGKGTMAVNAGGRSMNVTMDMRSTNLIDVATGLTKSASTVADSIVQIPGMGTMHQHMTTTMK